MKVEQMKFPSFSIGRLTTYLFTVSALILSPDAVQAQFSIRGIQIPSGRNQRVQAETVIPQVLRAVRAVRDSRNRVPDVVTPPTKPDVCPAPLPGAPVDNYPVPSPTPAAGVGHPAVKLTPIQRLVEDAKQHFKDGRYLQAATKLDGVIKLQAEDADAYQFRSLAWFAAGEHEKAAADAYDAFRFGNAWTWPVVRSLYPNGKSSIYTNQLRELEKASRSDGRTMSTHFLLAYQYVVLGHLEPAEKQLNIVLTLNPGEPLSRQLLAVVQNAGNKSQQKVSQK